MPRNDLDKLLNKYNITNDQYNQIYNAVSKKISENNKTLKDLENTQKTLNSESSKLENILKSQKVTQEKLYQQLQNAIDNNEDSKIIKQFQSQLIAQRQTVIDTLQQIEAVNQRNQEAADQLKAVQQKQSDTIDAEVKKTLNLRQKRTTVGSGVKAAATQVKRFQTRAANLTEQQQNLNKSSDTYQADYDALQKQIDSANKSAEKYLKQEKRARVATTAGNVVNFLDINKQQQKFQDKYNNAQQNLNDLQKRYNEGDSEVDEEMLNTAKKQLLKSEAQLKALNAIKDLQSMAINAINQTIDRVGQFQAQINTRLQGTGKTFQDFMQNVTTRLTTSLTISQQQMEDNMKALVEQGIVYNVEQRAYIMAAADRVASQFEVTNENLLRLIRLQQSDTTAARLGLESMLNEYLNSMFQDSSYLNGVFDTVSAAILDSTSSLSRDIGVEFEYIIQKWLGSLYSVGLSSEAVQTLASGINYLQTGNIQQLNNNPALQTLMAMSASRAGISYSEALISGLNASETNKLLVSMVDYLREIASSDNQVIRQAYSNLFSLGISDLTAISNLTSRDIQNIANSAYSYSQLYNRADTQIQTIGSRSSIGQMVSTLLDNIIYTTGANIAENPVTNVMWQINQLLTKTTGGGIKIPIPTVLGSGLPQFLNINEILSSGMAGLSLIGTAIKAISSIGNSISNPGLSMWDTFSSDYTMRGSGLLALDGTSSGTSFEGSYTANTSEDDLINSTLTQQKEDSDSYSEIMNADVKDQKTADDIYNELFVENKPIRVILSGTDDSTPLNVLVQNSGFDQLLQQIFMSASNINY